MKETQTRIYLTGPQRAAVEEIVAKTDLPFSRVVGMLVEYALKRVELKERPTVIYDLVFEGEDLGEIRRNYEAVMPEDGRAHRPFYYR